MFPNTPSIFGTGASGGSTASVHGKSGSILGAAFAGNPKTYAVVFVTPFSDATYSILLSGVDSRSYTFEAKTAAGFTINTNANAAVVGEVSWFATPAGETT